jgi:mono/diheme cytochrome c family protein
MNSFCVSVVLIGLSTASTLSAQAFDPGRGAFESRCARCHGADGNGGERGPAIITRLTTHDDQQLAGLIRDGLPAGGMPPSDVATTEMADLVKFLRTIQRRADARPIVRMTIQTDAGKTLNGQVLG